MKTNRCLKRITLVGFFLVFSLIIAAFVLADQSVSSVQWVTHSPISIPRPDRNKLVYATDRTSEQAISTEGREGVLLLEEGEEVTFSLDAPQDGHYRLRIGYLPLPGKGHDMEFALYIDDKQYGVEDGTLTLNRLWYDDGEIIKTVTGNDLRPKQKEALVWTEAPLMNPSSMDTELNFLLSAGSHTFRLINMRDDVILDYFYLQQKIPANTYTEYLATQAKANHTRERFILVQAENTAIKSAAAIYPTYDRTSALTQPYHSTELRLNTIGGSSWDEVGQWISWDLHVPEDGFYKLGFRYHQNKLKGYYVSRSLLIDGSLPYEELGDIHFPYDGKWQFDYLADKDSTPYLVYLTEGMHTFSLQVTLGNLTDVLEEMQQTVYELNTLYREIIMITGAEPDFYRDYYLDKAIPNLVDRVERLSADLTGYKVRMDALLGDESTAGEIIQVLVYQLDQFADYPYNIQKSMTTFQTNISSFAEWMLSIQRQPLELDYLVLASPEQKSLKANGNFWSQIKHEVFAFFGSFTQDYNSLVTTPLDDKKDANITVWMSTGRDQAYVVNRLIDESFTPLTGIHVDLKLVYGALLKATIAGEGPDVNLFTGRGEVMNLAFRGALAPLDKFDGYEETVRAYSADAMYPYSFNSFHYGMPETQDFYMMFCRDDIISELKLNIPKTWEELMDIAPILQSSNLGIGLPYMTLDGNATLANGIGTTSLFPSLLIQMGGEIYSKDHRSTLLNEPVAYKAFKLWTDFYTQYDYELYKDDFTRFRTGEMPIIISSYNMYPRLADTAPEIYGKWHMYLLPGMGRDDGSINNTSAANGTAAIVLADSLEEEASWEFVRWWVSEEIQARYAQDIEAELGTLGRHTSANLLAFERSNWAYREQKLLRNQWDRVVELPEIPGGYYVSRNLDNAFRAVVISYGNARENLFYWTNSTNSEIIRKRNEMGLD